MYWTRISASRWIWIASSRVGARMSARGDVPGASGGRRVAQQMGEEGDQERGRLARAGLRLSRDVVPRQRQRQDLAWIGVHR